MKMKILKTNKDLQIKKANELLSSLSKLDYETVLIVAIKNNEWEVFQSSYTNGFKLLGMLSIIKKSVIDWFVEEEC